MNQDFKELLAAFNAQGVALWYSLFVRSLVRTSPTWLVVFRLAVENGAGAFYQCVEERAAGES